MEVWSGGCALQTRSHGGIEVLNYGDGEEHLILCDRIAIMVLLLLANA